MRGVSSFRLNRSVFVAGAALVGLANAAYGVSAFMPVVTGLNQPIF
jgi:hypothetical protein